MSNFKHDRKRIARLAGGIHLNQDNEKIVTDRTDDLYNFQYESGLSMFENQRRYTYSSPELTMSQRKMDVAMRYTTLTGHFHRFKYNKQTYDDQLMTSLDRYQKYPIKIIQPTLYPSLILEIITDSKYGKNYKNNSDVWLKEAVHLAHKAWGIQYECMRANSPLLGAADTLDAINNMADRIKTDNLLSNIAHLVKVFEDIVTKINVISGRMGEDIDLNEQIRVHKNHNTYTIPEPNMHLEWSFLLCGVTYDGNYYLVPRPYIIMIHNKLSALLSVLLYAKLSEGTILDLNCYTTTIDYVSTLARIICIKGNDGYTVMKTLESLAIGESLSEVENWPNSDFLTNVVTDLYDDVKFSYYGSHLEQIFRSVSVPFRNELATLSKLLGHPYVDMEGGTKKLHTLVTESAEINMRSVQRCARYAVKSFIQTYLHEKGKWPLVRVLTHNIHRGLLHAMHHNRDPDSSDIVKKYGFIDVDNYNDIELLPVLEFGKLENAIPYLKDKTTAMCRNATYLKVLGGEIEHFDPGCIHNVDWKEPTITRENYMDHLEQMYKDYDIQMRKDFFDGRDTEEADSEWLEYTSSEEYIRSKKLIDMEIRKLKRELNKRKSTWSETRLLLLYMMTSEDTHDFTADIDKCVARRNFDLYQDYLVSKIVPKELELKIKFRGFGCLNPFPRHKNIMQERNVKKFLELYSDEQAAALSELALSKKLYAFRNIKKAYSGYRSLIINIDAKSWNTRWRDETVAPVMEKTLDKIFDYPIFSTTQRLYQHMLYFVEDPTFRAYWDGHEGGVEGQNQESWLHVYTNEIKVALERFDLPYHLLGKGDDMRIVILIPPQYLRNRDMGTIKEDIVHSISEVLRGFNHTIKVEESYGSELYFSFGKVASIGSIELPTAFRKISQTYGANNAFLPLLDDYASSSLSNGHSSSKVSMNPSHCYIVSLTWVYYYLLNCPEYRQCTEDDYIALAMIPANVGGLPLIYLHNMYVRAESDLFSPYLHIMMWLEDRYPPLYIRMKRFLTISYMKEKNYVMLLKDPYAIPIDRPELPLSLFKRMVRKSITRIIKHESLSKLFKTNTRSYTKTIINIMKSCNVVDTKVFSNLYACSPEGVVDEICNKFESSRSVNELIIVALGKSRARRIIIDVMKKESRLHRWRVNRLHGVYNRKKVTLYDPNIKFHCPSEYASHIRNYSWGLNITGVTMPPLQHQISVTTQLYSSMDSWSRLNHFTYKYIEPIEHLSKCNRNVYGSSQKRPFLGHATKTSTLSPTIQFIEKDAVLDKIQTLLNLLSWTNKRGPDANGTIIESNIDLVISYLLKFHTDRTVEDLMPFAAHRKSGTIPHHLRSPSFKESIVPNMLSNFYQQVVGESNTHITFSTTPGHFLINFLHVLCYTISLLYTNIEHHLQWIPPSVTWSVTTDCEWCVRPIEEVPIRCDASCDRGP